VREQIKTFLDRKQEGIKVNNNVMFVTDKTRETDLPGRESRKIQMGSSVGQSTTRLFLQHKNIQLSCSCTHL